MKILKTKIFGTPLLSIFLRATENYALAPKRLRKRLDFGVPVHKVIVNQSELVGLYTAANSNAVISTFECENKKLNWIKIDALKNAFGSLILANDKGVIAAPELKKNLPEIKEALEVENIETGTIAGMPTAGSCAFTTNDACITHPYITEPEKKKIEKTLGVEVRTGTVGRGNPYVGASLLGNSKKIFTPVGTTGPELARLDEIFRI